MLDDFEISNDHLFFKVYDSLWPHALGLEQYCTGLGLTRSTVTRNTKNSLEFRAHTVQELSDLLYNAQHTDMSKHLLPSVEK